MIRLRALTTIACLALTLGSAWAQTMPQPFDIEYTHYDYHVMLFFEGHPRYESMEAFIREGPDRSIRVTLTDNGQTQTDYLEDESAVAAFGKRGIDRDVRAAGIDYARKEAGGETSISLKLVTKHGEEVAFTLVSSGRPDAKYGGLVDVKGHSPDTSFPIIYCEASTLAGPKSSISFDGISYAIPVKVDASPFFVGLEGYFSKGMHIAVIRKGSRDVLVQSSPVAFSVGDSWQIRDGDASETWTITERNGEKLVIECPKQRIAANLSGGEIAIERIECKGPQVDKAFSITFAPRLELSASNSGKPSAFNISVAGKRNVVTGNASASRDGSSVSYRLNPQKPAWTRSRNVLVTLKPAGDSSRWDCSIGN